MSEHLSQKTLLLYLDGELPRKTRKLAARHLESCWQCRAAIEGLEENIHLIVEAHGCFLHAVPPPPRAWGSLDTRIAASKRKPRPAWDWSMFRPLYAGGLLVAVVCLVTWLLPGTMTAEQVLHRVAGNDNARMQSMASHLIRLRMRVTHTETRPARKTVETIECWSMANRSYWRVAALDGPGQSFRLRAADARLAGQLPLAPNAYQTWLQRIGTAPVLEPDGPNRMLLIASSGQHGRNQLWQVRLYVNTAAWQVSGMQLVYSQESLEITEEQFSVVLRRDAPRDVLASLEGTQPVDVPAADAARDKQFATPAAAQDLEAIELSTLVQLHRLKADLGEPIQVTRIGRKVVVQVAGVPPERQQELSRSLANRTGVFLRTTRDATWKGTPVTDITQPTGTTRTAAPDRANEGELRVFFGGFQEEENFTGVLLTRERALEGHLYALRDLARRFDPVRQVQLSLAARQDLEFLVTEHQNAAKQELSSMQTFLQPLLQRFVGASAAGPSVAKSDSWQENAARALFATQTADVALRRVLTTTDSPASPADALPAVERSLRDAQTVLQ